MNKTAVNITLLGKAYQINCPEGEVESLQKAAQLLEEKMYAVRKSAQVLSHDKIAVITAINLAHQLLLLENDTQQNMQGIAQRLDDLQYKVESALSHKTPHLVSVELASAI